MTVQEAEHLEYRIIPPILFRLRTTYMENF
nr:MAG TPA: hypothetical protein [Bacteriophage sp.]